MVRMLWGVLLTVALNVQAETVLRQLSVHDPRAYGYQLGDQIERQIELMLNDPAQLQMAALPKPGRLGNWLELNAVDVAQTDLDGGVQYSLTIRYQIMNIHAERQTVSAPTLVLPVQVGGQSLGFQIPALALEVTSLSGLQADPALVQAAMAPAPIDIERYRVSMLIAAAVLLSVGLMWIFIRWRQRPARVFAIACRQLHVESNDAAQVRRILHQTFDRIAGRTVFASELPRFWDEQPWLEPQKTVIEAFFADSERFFYQSAPVSEMLTTSDLLALCRACDRLERRR